MTMVINKKGIIFLAQTILNLADTVGLKKAMRIIQSNPEVFIELLGDSHILNKSGLNTTDISESFKWNDSNVEKNLKKLKLTDYQKLIIKTILNNNNSATLSDLEKEFEKQGIEVKTGSMIGGSLAGITKKCENYHVPPLFSNKDNTYYIVEEAVDSLPKYLN